MSNMTPEQQAEAVSRFGFDRPPADLPALYRRFEKEPAFHDVAQQVNTVLPGLEVDEILQVADTLHRVVGERL